ncbi:hypothetical protein AAC387_Pa06g1891 [Persea americana]
MLVNPMLELLFVFWRLALLLWPFKHMVAAGVFFSVDALQVSLVSRSSVVPAWRTRSTAMRRRRARGPSIPEMLLEPPDELSLLLDEEVSSQDSIMERLFLVAGSGLMTRLSPRGLRTWLGGRSVALPVCSLSWPLPLEGPSPFLVFGGIVFTSFLFSSPQTAPNCRQ